MAYRRDEMWSERYEYERLPRERLPPRPDDMQYTFGSVRLQEPESSSFSTCWILNEIEQDIYSQTVSFLSNQSAIGC